MGFVASVKEFFTPSKKKDPKNTPMMQSQKGKSNGGMSIS